jgi:hypothetical protein
MGDIAPSPATRIEVLSPGDGKNSDHPRPGKPLKVHPAPRNLTATPPVDVDLEKDEEHHLDERA